MVTAEMTGSRSALLAPITSTLDQLQARHGDPATTGLVPGLIVNGDAPGWVPATHLLTRSGAADLLDAAKQRWSAQPPAAAALAWKAYAYWVSLPAVLGYAAARRVPVLTPDNVLVHYTGHQPFLRIALRRPAVAVLAGDTAALDDPVAFDSSAGAGLRVVADDAALLAVLRQTLADQHLSPVLESIRELVRVGRRTLWGSVASAVAHGLSRAADVLPGPVLETAATLLSTLDGEDLVELVPQPDGGLYVQRRTCCLAFSLPEPKICAGCCIRPVPA
jgi:Ferric iron reductase FhuF-like transporter